MQLRFPSPDARSDFIAILQRDDPYLFTHVRPLFSQPTVALVSDVEMNAWVRLKNMLEASLGASVKIYDDIQFDVFGHAS